MKISLIGLILNDTRMRRKFGKILVDNDNHVPADVALDLLIQEYVNLRLGGSSDLVGETTFPNREFVVEVTAAQCSKALFSLTQHCRDTERLRYLTDAERLRYLMKDGGVEGFNHVKEDRYDYAFKVANEAGREEPTEEDELDGFRLMIDAAIAAEHEHAAGSL